MNKTEKEVYEKTLEIFEHKCVFCGNYYVHCHHIRYGACGRKTYMGNIIPLCEKHHRLVHSNKKKYQPMLIDIINKKNIENDNDLC